MLYTPVAIIEKGRSARTIFMGSDNMYYVVIGAYTQEVKKISSCRSVFTREQIKRAVRTASQQVRTDWNIYYMQAAGGIMADWREVEEYIAEHAPHLQNEYYQTELEFRWATPSGVRPEMGEEVYYIGRDWGAVLDTAEVDGVGVIYHFTWRTTGSGAKFQAFSDRRSLEAFIDDLEAQYGPAF